MLLRSLEQVVAELYFCRRYRMVAAICHEQFYEILPRDMRTWAQDKKPNT